MSSAKKTVIRVIFLALLVCFFFPFLTVSCDKTTVKTFSGMNMVFGTSVKDPTGSNQAENVKPSGYAILALLCGIAGFGVTFMKAKGGEVAAAASGILGFIFTLILRGKMTAGTQGAAYAGLQFKVRFGWYFVLLLFLAGAAYAIYVYMQQKSQPAFQGAGISPGAGPVPGGFQSPPNASPDPAVRNVKYCSQCGSPNNPINAFCAKCGSKM